MPLEGRSATKVLDHVNDLETQPPTYSAIGSAQSERSTAKCGVEINTILPEIWISLFEKPLRT